MLNEPPEGSHIISEAVNYKNIIAEVKRSTLLFESGCFFIGAEIQVYVVDQEKRKRFYTAWHCFYYSGVVFLIAPAAPERQQIA